MMIVHAFMLNSEFKFKTYLGLEFLQVEIPAPHILRISERFPNPRDRRVESSFDDNRFRQMVFRSHIFLGFCLGRVLVVTVDPIHR